MFPALQAKATTDLPGALSCLAGQVECFLYKSTVSAAKGKPVKGSYIISPSPCPPSQK